MTDRDVARPVRRRLGRRPAAIAALLRSLPDIALVAEAGSLEELARERRRTAPDVIVIDDRLLGGSGLGPRDADVPIIVIGLDDDPSFARRADRLGAADWIAKEHAGELLPDALEAARLRRGTPAPRPTA